MSTLDFEECLKECISQNDKIILKCNELKDEMNFYHQTCNGVKTAGTAVSVTGTGILVASLMAVPLTGGLSMIGTGGGLAMSLGGSATNLVTDWFDSYKTKDIIKLIEDLVKSKEELNNRLQKHFDSINEMKEELVKNDISHEEALFSILGGIANGAVDPTNIEPGSAALRLFTTLSKLSRAEDLLLETSKIAIKGLEKGFPAIQRALHTLGLTGGLSANTIKLLGRASAVFSTVISVVDIVLLVSEWNSSHPTIKVIDEVIDKINEENESLNEIHSLMDSLKERIHYTVIDGLPIVGRNEIFNQMAVHLLNNETHNCVALLKNNYEIEQSFKDLQTPEEIAQLLSSDTCSVVGLDKKETEAIIKKSDKSADQTVNDKLSNLLHNLKDYQKNGVEYKRESIGEYVINNKVILLYRQIIDKFVQKTYNCSFAELTRIPTQSVVYNDYYYSPLSESVRYNIEKEMLATIPDKVWYINSHAIIYGFMAASLSDCAQLHMANLYKTSDEQTTTSTDYLSKIRSTVYLMNQLRVYVDEYALQYWLTHNGGNRSSFDESRLAIQEMSQNLIDKMNTWVTEIKQYQPNRLYPVL